MKIIKALVLLILTIGNIRAVDLESAQFINRILSLPGPVAPVLFEDSVIFTAPAAHRSVGIAFAHEDYSKVHLFRRLMVPEDPAIVAESNRRTPELYREAGLLFHVQPFGVDMQNLDYRLIIDGLWVPDPLGPVSLRSSSGISYSRVPLPQRSRYLPIQEQDVSAGALFSFKAPPGEYITIGGSFNNWDPFMYELKETSPGLYSIHLMLPRGIYQYVFYHKGQRLHDVNNIRRVYTIDGKILSEIEIR